MKLPHVSCCCWHPLLAFLFIQIRAKSNKRKINKLCHNLLGRHKSIKHQVNISNTKVKEKLVSLCLHQIGCVEEKEEEELGHIRLNETIASFYILNDSNALLPLPTPQITIYFQSPPLSSLSKIRKQARFSICM